jgi:hypothetical protein
MDGRSEGGEGEGIRGSVTWNAEGLHEEVGRNNYRQHERLVGRAVPERYASGSGEEGLIA